MPYEEKRGYLKTRIGKEVYQKLQPTDDLYYKNASWIFDFRKVFLNADFIRTAAELFWNEFEDAYPFQVGGVESAAIPLITAIVLEGQKRERVVSGFYMRKSRKKSGLGRIIEGTLTNDPVILVDDLINFGNSFSKLKGTLDLEHTQIRAVFALVRYRSLEYYKKHFSNEIPVHTLFTLEDFGKKLQGEPAYPEKLEYAWYFRSNDADYFYHLRKSDPVLLTDNKLVIGSDSGILWFLDAQTGSILSKLRLGLPWKRRYVQHTPLILDSQIVVTSVNGNVHSVDLNGKRVQWGFFEIDMCNNAAKYIDGTICVLGESKLPGRQTELLFFEPSTGSLLQRVSFAQSAIRNFLVDETNNLVLVITQDGTLHAMRPNDGKVVSRIESSTLLNGTGSYDRHTSEVFVTSSTGSLVVFNLKKNTFRKHDIHIAAWSGVCATEDRIYMTSLYKTIYALSRTNLNVLWEYETRGRIFATPTLRKEKLYVGSNDGRLYVLDVVTGKSIAQFQTTERIINGVTFHPNGTPYVVTQGNEIYALKGLNAHGDEMQT